MSGPLRAAMSARVANREMPGIVTLVARGDGVEVETIGTVAFDDTEPMRRDTPFRITSMTKPVVAATALTLVDEGLLRLDEPVDRLLPELAERRVLRRIDGALDDTVPAERAITVEDLLTFRLGFGHVTEPTFDPPYPIVERPNELELRLGPPDPGSPHSPDEWIRLFGTLPLMEQPGTRWRYNVGSLVLGVLVARAAGVPLAEAVRERVLVPLKMFDSGFHTTPESARRLPAHYWGDQDTGELIEPAASKEADWTSAPVFPSGAAGLVSTVDDYHAFARMLLAGGGPVLTPGSVAAMTTNQLTPDQIASGGVLLGGQGWGYGLGVITTPTPEGLDGGQYGWSGGYGTTWFNDPARDFTAIALTQVTNFLWNGGLQEFERLAFRTALD
jgi:CubicO group peptidase (beta-lactamase class C family)